MNKFYEKLNIPNNCIVDNTIFKKAFLENADMTSLDKKIINEHIKKVIWKYSLKPDTINVMPYISDERDYYEIEFIEVQLNETSKIKRIAEIVMRAIPYPIFLIFNDGERIQLATGDMRKNLSDNSKVTVDEFVFTDWISINEPDKFTLKLFDSLNINNLSFSNYYQMYQDLTSKLNFYNISRTKGEIISEDKTDMSNSDIKKYYDEIVTIDNQIASLKSKIKKSSIKEKVEINIKINELKQKKEMISNKI